jgi:hypothetical protein|nr:M28 family metallopeptidase [Kofleriaceae bacterium]
MRALLLVCLAACGAPAAADTKSCSTPFEIITALAKPDLDGRLPGTAGDHKARAIIADELTCRGLTVTSQEFDADGGKGKTANLYATVKGTSDDIVLVTAHHDHLGHGHLGANDNASGAAGVIEIAGMMQGHANVEPPKRTMVFVWFGDEEDGMVGSTYFAKHPPIALDKVVQVVNLDMIGSYKSQGFVAAMGTFKGLAARALADPLIADAKKAGLDIIPGGKARGSDFQPFCDVGIPYVFLWTPDDRCYHETCDTPDRIDAKHLEPIIGFGRDLVDQLQSTDVDLLAARQKLGCFGKP